MNTRTTPMLAPKLLPLSVMNSPPSQLSAASAETEVIAGATKLPASSRLHQP